MVASCFRDICNDCILGANIMDNIDNFGFDGSLVGLNSIVCSVMNGQTYNLSYSARNHLAGVSSSASATFACDGDGRRVQSVLGGITTVFVREYFEWRLNCMAFIENQVAYG